MSKDSKKSDAPEAKSDAKATAGVEVKPSTSSAKPTQDKSRQDKASKVGRKRKPKPPVKVRSKEKKGVRFGTAFVMMVLAALGGAVLSQVYERYSSTETQTVSVSDFQSLQTQVKTLSGQEEVDLTPFIKRIEVLEAALRPAIQNSDVPSASIPADIETRIIALETAVAPDLTEIETRLLTLEERPVVAGSETANADVPEVENIRDRLDALEALEFSELQARLSALEGVEKEASEPDTRLLTRLEVLENVIETLPAPVDVTSVETRISALETQAQKLKLTQEDVIRASGPLPPFPSEAILAALENTDMNAEKGWLEKTFDKYVLADNAEAIKAVSRVETLLQQGRVDMALEQVEALPEPGQTAAKDWIDAVKAQRK